MGVFRKADRLFGHGKSVIVHADDKWFSHVADGECLFFERLGAELANAGHEPLIVHSDDLRSLVLLQGGGRHIMMGPKRHRGPNIHHAHPGYIRGFWYLDPRGYFWNSSLVDEQFQPETVDARAADRFLETTARRLIGKNLSKRPQRPRGAVPVERADVLVVTQDIEKYRKQVHYLTTEEIIRSTAEASDSVHVKLHPLHGPEMRDRIARVADGLANVRVVDASVHDLIAASDVVVSQNSAVGFEALMQRKAVLTCAKTDYHHATLVCRSVADLHRNLSRAAAFAEAFPFARYFYWFLCLNLLKPQDDDFPQRAMDILFTNDDPAVASTATGRGES